MVIGVAATGAAIVRLCFGLPRSEGRYTAATLAGGAAARLTICG